MSSYTDFKKRVNEESAQKAERRQEAAAAPSASPSTASTYQQFKSRINSGERAGTGGNVGLYSAVKQYERKLQQPQKQRNDWLREYQSALDAANGGGDASDTTKRFHDLLTSFDEVPTAGLSTAQRKQWQQMYDDLASYYSKTGSLAPFASQRAAKEYYAQQEGGKQGLPQPGTTLPKGETSQKEEKGAGEKLWNRFMGSLGTPQIIGTTTSPYELTTDTGYKEPTKEWTQEERDVYEALMLGSPEKADRFAIDTNNRYNKEKRVREQEQAQEWGKEHKALAWGANTFSGVASMGMGDFLNAGMERAIRGEVTEKEHATPRQLAEAASGGASQGLNEEYGTINEKVPVLGGKGLGELYQITQSIAQSMALANGTGSLGKAGAYLTDAVFFGNSAASAFDDAKRRGATDDQAYLFGALNGVNEALGEHLSIENLITMKDPRTLAELAKNILKQAYIEGSEEAFTTFLNNWAEQFVMKDKSNFYELVNEYTAQGMDEKEAKKKAWLSLANDMAFDFVGGAFSGDVSGGLQSGYNYITSNTYASRYYRSSQQELVQEALDINPDNQTAKKAQEYIKQGKNVPGNLLSQMIEMNDSTVLRETVKARLEELGETGDLKKLTEAVIAGASEEGASRKQQKALKNSQFGQQVAQEVKKGSIWDNAQAENTEAAPSPSDTMQRETQTVEAGAEQATENRGATAEERTPAAQERGTERDYRNNDSGQAYLLGSREPVNIRKVAAAENGSLTLELDTGETVDGKDVSFGSFGEARLYQAVASMGVDADTANRVLSMQKNSSLSQTAYASAAQEAYQLGRRGVEFEKIRKASPAAYLSEGMRRDIWEMGRASAQAQSQQREAILNSGSHKTATAGLRLDQSVKAMNSFSRQQKTAMEVAKILSDAGLSIEVYASTAEQRASGMENGSFSTTDGSIRFDINAGRDGSGTAAYVLGHEVTHFAREFGTGKYQTMLDTLVAAVGETDASYEGLLDRKITELRKMEAYKSLNETELGDIAKDEVVAEMFETVFTDTDAAQRLSQSLYAKDKTLWGKFKEFVSGLVERLREAYKGLNPDSTIARQMKDTVTQSEQVLNAWVEAVSEAVENYRMQDGERTNSGQETRLSAREQKTAESLVSQLQEHRQELSNMEPVAEVDGTELNKNLRPVDAAMEYVRSFGGKVLRADFGEVRFSKTKIKSGLVGHGIGNAKMETFAAVPAVIREGKQIGYADNWKNSHKESYVFAAPITYNGEESYVGVIVEKDNQSGMYYVHEAVDSGGNVFSFDSKKEESTSDRLLTLPGRGDTVADSSEDRVTQEDGEVKGNVRYSARSQTESEEFKQWFGDWQNDPSNASKAVNTDGTPKVLYHQTSADFTIFEPRHEGAGTRDQDTPFGIFMKSSDRNIGVKGEKQMALYARIVNPLRVTDRADLMYQLGKISPEYEKASAELRSLNDAYQQKHEDTKKAFADYIVKWRQENPDASRTAIYDDAGFNEVYEAEDNVLDEWEAEARKVELRSKEAITRDLEKQGYDGVIIQNDKGSFGRSTDAYIALHPEQVKSATDNVGTFDKSNPDIRFSQRQEDALKRQNERQKEEIGRLRELVDIQKYGNKDFTLDQNSVKRQALDLMNAVGAKGKSVEFSAILGEFYRNIGTNRELSWEDVSKSAQKAVDWLMDNKKQERDPYSQEILDWMKGRHVALSEDQVNEAAYLYGSLKEFRKAIKGTIVLDQTANTSLDQFWQEAAAQYGDKFSSDTNAGDMPGVLAELVDSLRNGESVGAQEERYYEREIRQDLTRQVYDSYWNVKPVGSIRDEMQKKMDLLKAEHARAMEDARTALKDERANGKQAIEDYRKQRDVVEATMMAAYAQQRDQVERAYVQEMEDLRKTYGADTATYQEEFFTAMKNSDFQEAKSPSLRRMLNELAHDNSLGNKDAEAARKQVYDNLRQQYELENEKERHKEDNSTWEREFSRLQKNSEKSIDRLESKVRQQREAAHEKVESRRRTELRRQIYKKADTFRRMALTPGKGDTLHAPVSLMGALADFCDVFYQSEARAAQRQRIELTARETVNQSMLGLEQEARRRLAEIGGVYDINGVAAAILKELTGKRLSKTDQALINGKAGKQVLQELKNRQGAIFGQTQADSSTALTKEAETIQRQQDLLDRRTNAINALRDAYGKLKEDRAQSIFYDEHVQELVDHLEETLRNSDISGMSASQLEEVYGVMKAMEYTIVNANKVFSAGKDKTLIGMTNKLTAEIKAVDVKHNPLMNKAREYLMWQMRPDTFFSYLCGYGKDNEGKAIQKMFVNGSERMLGVQREFYQLFRPLTEATDKKTRKAVKELIGNPMKDMVYWGLKDANGQEVKTSKGMAMQAYLLLSQEDSFNSILHGGFKLPNAKEFYKGNADAAYSNADSGSLLSEAIGESYQNLVHDIQEAQAPLRDLEKQIKELKAEPDSFYKREQLASLEDRRQVAQKRVNELQAQAENMTAGAAAELIGIRDKLAAIIRADPVMSALVDSGAQWYKRTGELLAEVHEGMYGYRPNLVDGYAPIRRDLTNVKTDVREDNGKAFNLENIGLTKERVPSYAPIRLTDFFQELSNHTGEISRFYGFAQVQKDFNRIWNLEMPGSRTTVNSLVADKYGAGKTLFGVSGEEYVNNYIKSVAGSSGSGSILDKFYGAAASATLSINPRVAISQAASIPTAAAEVGWGSMARGFAKGLQTALSGKGRTQLANDSIWFWQRYRGAGGSTEIGDLKYQGNLWARVSGSKAGKALFNWCQAMDVFSTASMWAMAEDAVERQQGLKPGAEGYQEAVTQKYADIIRNTQPNYTTTERSDLLRDKREGMKLLTMYKTQSNQNLNILMDSWGEYKAVLDGLKNGDSRYTQADRKAAGRRLANGVTSVTIGGTLAFVLMRTAVNLVMGNLKYYRDDDTDEVTGKGILDGMLGEVFSSVAGMFALGGQLEEIIYSAVTGGRYYGISDSAIGVIATAAEGGQKVLATIFDQESEPEARTEKMKKYSKNLFYSTMTAFGVPAKNIRTMLEAVDTWFTAATEGIPAAMESGDTTDTQYRARILRGWENGDMEKIQDTLAILAARSDEDTDEKIQKDVTGGVASYLKKQYQKGKVSGEEAQKLLEYIGHEDPEGIVQKWEFQEEHPESKLSGAGIAKWSQNQNIPLDVFEDAYRYKGEHKKTEVVSYIRGLSISDAMKRQLWDAIRGSWTSKDTPW